jgi:photosystem II stability/assembly factor-like uncharacterized protein
MILMCLATGDAVAIVRHQRGRWEASIQLDGRPARCVGADPLRPARIYCGTYGQGVWRSDDAGRSWRPAGEGIAHAEVTSVAASASERVDGAGVVWAGTEPSAVFRSEDGGETWRERPALRTIPSAPTWSFPPRPWTHHVRSIAPDPVVPERIFVGIELGGVMRSLDGGLTWEDRKPGSQPDAHTLAGHPQAPGRVYEAAGGGYAESQDGGATWHRRDAGLEHRYLWSVAVDPADPETMVVSAAAGPREAHDPSHAESTVYRRMAGAAWEEVRIGLPARRGTRACELAPNQAEPGVFYAATREGAIYRSSDAGLTWESLDVVWPDERRPAVVHALVVVDV